MGCTNCDVVVRGGEGVRVSGSGSPTNPFIIESDLPDYRDILRVRDTTSLNLSLFGNGTIEDPFTLRGDVTVALTDLVDIDDPEGGPLPGEVPVWVGTDSADGHWEFKTPPPAPAGAVNASGGIIGSGTSGDPLRAAVSGTWGVAPLDTYGADPSVGALVYIDGNGQLRAQPQAATAPGGGTADSVAWANITGKPTTFPPSAHTHVASDLVLAEQRKLDVGRIEGKRIMVAANAPTNGVAVNDIWIRP